MEQQESFQGLTTDSQQAPDPAPELNWNDASVEIEFKHGMYYCKDLEGGYLTRDTLKKAWRMKIWKEKMTKAQELREKSTHSGKMTPEERGKMRTTADGLEKKWKNPLEVPLKRGKKKQHESV